MVEREAGPGERDIEKMRTEVKMLHKKVDATGWRRNTRAKRRCAVRRTTRCTIRRCVAYHLGRISARLI